jgi:acetyltransferase-like isoleucine patch superfamily enzyme
MLPREVTKTSGGIFLGPVKLGKNVTIRPFALIYPDVEIGDDSTICSFTTIREKTVIGKNSTIGNLCAVEHEVKIGDHVSVYAQCHLTSGLIIEDRVFMAVHVSTLNTRKISHGRDYEVVREAPVIKYGARIGGGVVILPGVTIGREALVGAGSLVTRDVPDYKIVIGSPAKVVGDVPEDERLPGE